MGGGGGGGGGMGGGMRFARLREAGPMKASMSCRLCRPRPFGVGQAVGRWVGRCGGLGGRGRWGGARERLGSPQLPWQTDPTHNFLRIKTTKEATQRGKRPKTSVKCGEGRKGLD